MAGWQLSAQGVQATGQVQAFLVEHGQPTSGLDLGVFELGGICQQAGCSNIQSRHTRGHKGFGRLVVVPSGRRQIEGVTCVALYWTQPSGKIRE
ncbi:hypothetical protein D3C78_1671150 [compost metagenome]